MGGYEDCRLERVVEEWEGAWYKSQDNDTAMTRYT